MNSHYAFSQDSQATSTSPVADSSATKALISCFRRVTETKTQSFNAIDSVLKNIKTGRWQERVSQCRYHYSSDEEAYAKAKHELPAFIASVECTTRSKEVPFAEKIIRYNNLILLDFDHLSAKGVDSASLKKALHSDPYVHFCFDSVSQDGLKVGVLLHYENVDEARLQVGHYEEDYLRCLHRQAYQTLSQHFQKKHHLSADKQCSDLFRACFVSYDPALFSNPDSKAFVILDHQGHEATIKTQTLHRATPTDATPSSVKRIFKGVSEEIRGVKVKISEKGKAAAQDLLKKVIEKIARAPDGQRHMARLQLSRLIGGYMATGYFSDSEAFSALTAAALTNTAQSQEKIEADIQDGLEHGKKDPLYFNSVLIDIRECPQQGEPSQPPHILERQLIRDKKFIKLAYNPERDDAAFLAQLFKNQLLYIPEKKSFQIYQENGWFPAPAYYETYLMDVLTEAYESFQKSLLTKHSISCKDDNEDRKLHSAVARKIIRLKTAAYKNNVMHYVATACTKSITDFDHDPLHFAMDNGVLDLSTRTFIPYNPTHYITIRSKHAYDPAAKCPKFLEFIHTIFNNNAELIQFVQKYLGLCLTGKTHTSFLFCYGEGHNGKSMLFDIIAAILGDFVGNGDELLNNNYGRGEYYRAVLVKKRLVTISEISSEKKFTSEIKKYIGNDAISARLPAGVPFNFKPEFKLIASSNHKPEVKDSSNGFWRRFLLIPFSYTFPEEKTDSYDYYYQTYMEESAGIINWLVQGYYAYEDKGLQVPAQVRAAVEDYRNTSMAWNSNLEEYIEYTRKQGVFNYHPGDASLQVTTEEFHQEYALWCTDNSDSVLAKGVVSKKLKALGYKLDRQYRQGQQWRVYLGIGKVESETLIVEAVKTETETETEIEAMPEAPVKKRGLRLKDIVLRTRTQNSGAKPKRSVLMTGN